MQIGRMHLFEFNDSDWCPRVIRESITEALGWSLITGGIYSALVAPFELFLNYSGSKVLLDMCSGSGEPAVFLAKALQRRGDRRPRFILTDLMPSVTAQKRLCASRSADVSWVGRPVDALSPGQLPFHDARTFFSSFHHFKPQEARSLLKQAADAGKAVFVAEPFTTTPSSFRPLFKLGRRAYIHAATGSGRSAARLLFTMVVPLIPIMGLWDGLVSQGRCYGGSELMDMGASAAPGYHWEFHEVPYGRDGGCLSVFWGAPQRR